MLTVQGVRLSNGTNYLRLLRPIDNRALMYQQDIETGNWYPIPRPAPGPWNPDETQVAQTTIM